MEPTKPQTLRCAIYSRKSSEEVLAIPASTSQSWNERSGTRPMNSSTLTPHALKGRPANR